MSDNNNNNGYFYTGYDDKNEDYSAYGGTQTEHEEAQEIKDYVRADKAKATVRNSVTLLVSLGVGAIITFIFVLMMFRQIVPLINPYLNIVKGVYGVTALAIIGYYVFMVFTSVKKQNEINAKCLIHTSVLSLVCLILAILTNMILPPSKLLFGVLLAAAGGYTVFTVVYMIKNSYRTGIAFCIAIFVFLSSFITMKVLITPIYTPVVDFNTKSFVITSDESLKFVDGIKGIYLTELKDEDLSGEYSAFEDLLPECEVISSYEELEAYLQSVGTVNEDTDVKNKNILSAIDKLKKTFTEETKAYDEDYFKENALIINKDHLIYPNFKVDNYKVGKLYTNFCSDLLILDVDQHYIDLNFNNNIPYYNDSVCYILISIPREKIEGISNYVVMTRDTVSK